MNKVGISTVYTGYNYGSALQAYSVKRILNKIGYESVIFKLAGSVIPGRDVRLRKILCIAVRMLLNFKLAKKIIGVYGDSMSANFLSDTVSAYHNFFDEQLKIENITWAQLKSKANGDEFCAFFCGSDQIWKADTFYVDPFYYLRYAPKHKRIAFAPSFGRAEIPKYNRNIIRKYISGIPRLSVREESGAEIIESLLGKKVPVLIDPTLMLSLEDWGSEFDLKSIIDGKYILAYFLNEPSKNTKKQIRNLAKQKKLKIIGIPYAFKDESFIDLVYAAGPIEFLKLIRNADVVCTDSFHGTAFSLNFKVKFYTFERNYGKAGVQSTRIISLLKKTNTEDRFYTDGTLEDTEIDFEYVSSVLNQEKEKGVKYILESLREVINYDRR